MNIGVVIIILIVVLFLYFNSQCTQNENMTQNLSFDYRYYAMNNPNILKTYWKPEYGRFPDELPDKFPEQCLPNPFPGQLKQDLINHWKNSGSSMDAHRYCSGPCPESTVVAEECPLFESNTDVNQVDISIADHQVAMPDVSPDPEPSESLIAQQETCSSCLSTCMPWITEKLANDPKKNTKMAWISEILGN
jgi:hypothetical protein